MSLSGFFFGPHVRAPAPGPDPRADALIDGYVAWREACGDVDAAYQRWASCEPADRGLAFAAYLAALEHEEHAARVYERECARVRRRSDAPAGAWRGIG